MKRLDKILLGILITLVVVIGLGFTLWLSVRDNLQNIDIAVENAQMTLTAIHEADDAFP
jgi:hypothetical protein